MWSCHNEQQKKPIKKNATRYNQMTVATVDVLTSYDAVTNDDR